MWCDPLKRNLFVEIDYMDTNPDPSFNRKPYAGLVSDVAGIFDLDSSHTIITSVFIDNSVPWFKNICFGPCPPYTADPIDFYQLKAPNFSNLNAERRPYFHYAVWAYRQPGGRGQDSCISGMAETPGNDLIITLGCLVPPTEADQRGAFMHELGHNLTLTHNNNDYGTQWSTFHEGVMNYRYQLPGIPITGRHTYSNSSACTDCSTSPKYHCSLCRGSQPIGAACAPGYCWPPDTPETCDCSVPEWSLIDMYPGSSEYLDGVEMAGASASGDTTDNAGQTKTASSLYAGKLLGKRSPEERRAWVAAQKDELLSRGQIEGSHFTVVGDNRTIVSVCQ